MVNTKKQFDKDQKSLIDTMEKVAKVIAVQNETIRTIKMHQILPCGMCMDNARLLASIMSARALMCGVDLINSKGNLTPEILSTALANVGLSPSSISSACPFNLSCQYSQRSTNMLTNCSADNPMVMLNSLPMIDICPIILYPLVKKLEEEHDRILGTRRGICGDRDIHG
jgi:hypothetical protein